MVFSDWQTIAEIAVTSVVVYAALVVLLRVTGKRTTSKMNNFDWIVTVALGSMVSTVILIEEVVLLEGLTAIVALVVLQFCVTWTVVRCSKAGKLLKSSPRLLYYRGEFCEKALRQERVTEEEILSAMRQQGHLSPDSVAAVVMESNAHLSIICGSDGDGEQTLTNVVAQ